MKRDPILAHVLSTRIIANCSQSLARQLGAPDSVRSLAILTGDSDDVMYTALDEATKTADVQVIYAKSMYAGADNATTRLAGEVIGILAGETPAAVRSGLQAAVRFVETEGHFTSANDDNTIPYYNHVVSRTGSYLSSCAGIREGEPLAYLIAPPLEAMFGVDMAMKAADVRMCVLYAPPSETNFGGALLTGSQSACRAAADAFAEAVEMIAANPKER